MDAVAAEEEWGKEMRPPEEVECDVLIVGGGQVPEQGLSLSPLASSGPVPVRSLVLCTRKAVHEHLT